MHDPTIICPHCNTEIRLTESLAAPLVQTIRKEYEQRLEQKETEINGRETTLRQQQLALVKAEESLELRVATQVQEQRNAIVAEESRKARTLLAAELEGKANEVTELQNVLKQRDEKLADAQRTQAELIKKQRELDDARREIELTIEKRVQESLSSVRETAKIEAEENLKLKVLEKEQTISSMQQQIEELRRRAEQGSQQLQGEALEIELESLLTKHFPFDQIAPVPKGEHGGDVIHSVYSSMGQACGKILWESKRTKNWNDDWLRKLRDDQRQSKSEIAVLVSQTLPDGIDTFHLVDGVFIASIRCAFPIAVVLRNSLIELSAARQSKDGQQTKMELVYQYLTGPRFRHRIDAIVEKFKDMSEDLDRERKTLTRLWAKREEQIRGVIDATSGMYGDLQGIAGKTLQEIEGLTLPLLDGPTTNNDSDHNSLF